MRNAKTVTQIKTHDVTPRANLALRGFESGTEKPAHSYVIFHCFNRVSVIPTTTKPQLCPCDSPITQKNICHATT